MRIRKDLIFAVLTTFCMCALMFTVIPIRSGLPYDPWADYDDNDKIDMKDIGNVAARFGTLNTDNLTRNVNVTNWPQDRPLTIKEGIEKIEAEIQNIVFRKVALPTVNIRDFVLKKGVSHLVGAKPELVFKKGFASPEVIQEIEKKLLDKLEEPKTIELLLKQSLPKSLILGLEEPVKEMEKIRQELREIKDNNLRKRVFLARNILAVVVPELAKISIEYNLPKHFFIGEKPTLRDVNKFLGSIPTALCFFTLIFQRDQQFQRPIPKNDFNDIWFLTLAIPYCDIVVTERMWTSIARQAKLDKICNTVILPSLSELGKYA